ncbi:hypothetical protein, partial [Enterocloster clostridioformis]
MCNKESYICSTSNITLVDIIIAREPDFVKRKSVTFPPPAVTFPPLTKGRCQKANAKKPMPKGRRQTPIQRAGEKRAPGPNTGFYAGFDISHESGIKYLLPDLLT